MASPFIGGLTAAPVGGKVAWVPYSKGRRNITVAGTPGYEARAVMRYSEDGGQEIADVRWTPGASASLPVRRQP